MAKPTVLLVPGAWHLPAHYDKLLQIPTQHGYECEGVSLATVDPKDPPNTNADSDVEVISAAIKKTLSSGKDVVLVTHSYGGIPVQSAAYSFIDQNERSPRVVAIAMMCTFLYPPQTALLAPLGSKPAPVHDVSDDGNLVYVGPPGPEFYFYTGVSAEETAEAVAMIKPHAWRSKTVPPSAPGAGYWGIPTSYLICEQDNAIPAGFQKKMVADANEDLEKRGSKLTIRTEVVDSGHSPFLTMPEETAAFIRRTAGEEL